jgi:hypothetical protein
MIWCPPESVGGLKSCFSSKERCMKRALWIVPGLLALSVVIGYCAEDVSSIDDIMTRAHKNKTGLRDQIATELKKSTPDWADVQKKTKEFVGLAGSLTKFDPPKGDKGSWKKLADAYTADVKSLDAAAGKKDQPTAVKAVEKLKTGCTPCHDAHRE